MQIEWILWTHWQRSSPFIKLQPLNQINMKALQIPFVNSTMIVNLVSYWILGFIVSKTYSVSNVQIPMTQLKFAYSWEDLEHVNMINMGISSCYKILGIYLLITQSKYYLQFMGNNPYHSTFATSVLKYQKPIQELSHLCWKSKSRIWTI